MLRAAIFLPVFFLAGVLPAQTPPPVAGPVAGFIFDPPTKSFRAIVGSLGSASLGPAILDRLDAGSVAPGLNHGIAFRDGQGLIVSGLGSAEVSTTSLPGSFPIPEGVAWSGNGSVAVLYSRSGNWLQTIRDLPNSATAGPLLAGSTLGGHLLAVTATSDRIVLGLSGETGGIYQLLDGVTLSPLLSLSKPVALAFAADRGRLYAVDAASRHLVELDTATLASESWPLEGLEDPVAIGVARDPGNRNVLYVAGGKDRLLHAYDASSREQIANISLDAEPTAIEPLGRNGFLLGARTDLRAPLWSFTNASQPVVYFIPAPPPQAQEAAGQ